jgi:CRISPR/Cas system-associated endonuclease Cas1
MRSLYVSMQGCYVGLSQELLVVKQGQTVLQEVQLPLLEQVLIFGKSQVTTQAIRECLRRDIPIAYLSRMGFCYGRTMAWLSAVGALSAKFVVDGAVADGAANCEGEDFEWAGVVDASGEKSCC